jgi:hypothetical protein
VIIAASENDKHLLSSFWLNLGGWSSDARHTWRRLVHSLEHFVKVLLARRREIPTNPDEGTKRPFLTYAKVPILSIVFELFVKFNPQ